MVQFTKGQHHLITIYPQLGVSDVRIFGCGHGTRSYGRGGVISNSKDKFLEVIIVIFNIQVFFQRPVDELGEEDLVAAAVLVDQVELRVDVRDGTNPLYAKVFVDLKVSRSITYDQIKPPTVSSLLRTLSLVNSSLETF